MSKNVKNVDFPTTFQKKAIQEELHHYERRFSMAPKHQFTGSQVRRSFINVHLFIIFPYQERVEFQPDW